MIFVPGFGIANYRSFRAPLQTIEQLSKVNMIAGQNNAGKSNVLRFIARFLRESPEFPTLLDRPLSAPATTPTLALPWRADENAVNKFAEEARLTTTYISQFMDGVRKFSAVPDDPDHVWIEFMLGSAKIGERTTWAISNTQIEQIAGGFEHSPLSGIASEISGALTGTRGGIPDNVLKVLNRFIKLETLPAVETIEAFRQIRPLADEPGNSIQFMPNGEGLIRGLQRLERPGIENNQRDKARFAAINSFVQRVLDDHTARLEIPSDAATIHVAQKDQVLPLEHLGTGVHQVVILASAATLIEDSIICIEEPEVHLHPLLQRKLIRYLETTTSNQYFIATHSAHLLDHEKASVYHIQATVNGSEIARAGTPHDVFSICADLGYRASDLLQSNAIIWVEGPSDRIYLQHWISYKDPSLIEGIHYSIMFYGGRLLSHLSADDAEVKEFISLRRMNRRSAIIIDSDKSSPQSRIRDTKLRIRAEFDGPQSPGLCWITACREIENYLRPGSLTEAVQQTHSKATYQYDGGRYEKPLLLSNPKDPDKVKIARNYVSLDQGPDLSRFDLKRQVDRLVQFIKESNQI